MTNLPRRSTLPPGTAMHDLRWSAAEKAIARKAFNLALERELQAVILEAKSRAAKIQEPSRSLGPGTVPHQTPAGSRSHVRLPLTRSFRSFLQISSRKGRLVEDELHGLGEDKLGWIQHCSLYIFSTVNLLATPWGKLLKTPFGGVHSQPSSAGRVESAVFPNSSVKMDRLWVTGARHYMLLKITMLRRITLWCVAGLVVLGRDFSQSMDWI